MKAVNPLRFLKYSKQQFFDSDLFLFQKPGNRASEILKYYKLESTPVVLRIHNNGSQKIKDPILGTNYDSSNVSKRSNNQLENCHENYSFFLSDFLNSQDRRFFDSNFFQRTETGSFLILKYFKTLKQMVL